MPTVEPEENSFTHRSKRYKVKYMAGYGELYNIKDDDNGVGRLDRNGRDAGQGETKEKV